MAMAIGALAAAHVGHNHQDECHHSGSHTRLPALIPAVRARLVACDAKNCSETEAQAERTTRAGMGGAESFESWQAQLMGHAKLEPGASHLCLMPPKSMKLFEGPMEKKAIASASGVKWQALFVQAFTCFSERTRERERARERENSARDSAERESLDALLNGGSRAEVGAWSM